MIGKYSAPFKIYIRLRQHVIEHVAIDELPHVIVAVLRGAEMLQPLLLLWVNLGFKADLESTRVLAFEVIIGEESSILCHRRQAILVKA